MITQSNAPRPSSVEPVKLQIQILISARVNTFDLVNAIMFFVSVSRAVAAVRGHRFQRRALPSGRKQLGRSAKRFGTPQWK
jgi:hypothetical protein